MDVKGPFPSTVGVVAAATAAIIGVLVIAGGYRRWLKMELDFTRG